MAGARRPGRAHSRGIAGGAAGELLSDPAPQEALARLRGITKSFGTAPPALQGVDLEVRPGEIHALLGENGAGKTTLMNILIGLVRADAGTFELAGRPVDLDRYGPSRARRDGLAMVHQHSTLVGPLTVVENLTFGDSEAGLLFHPRRERERVAALAERFGIEVPLTTQVDDLSTGQRQRAEILRALDRGAKLLILDEPTASLTPGETDALLPSLRQLREAGRGIIFISHRLDEIEALADRVTVLRQGRVVASNDARMLDSAALGRLMLGRDLPPLERPARVSSRGAAALAIRGISAAGVREASRLKSIDLEVAAGEIVGVAGIDGNGQRELEEVLVGLRRPSAGSIEVGGVRVAPGTRSLRDAGVAHLSGERERSGLVPGFTTAENLILKGSYDDPRFFPRGWLDLEAARRAARQAAARFGIVPDDPETDIANLSGGNAQKVAVARELESDPPVLIAVSPTRGLDVGSARFVHERLLALRAGGAAVLLVSTDLDEVLALADRLVVLVGGRIRPVPAGADRAALGAIMLGREAA